MSDKIKSINKWLIRLIVAILMLYGVVIFTGLTVLLFLLY